MYSNSLLYIPQYLAFSAHVRVIINRCQSVHSPFLIIVCSVTSYFCNVVLTMKIISMKVSNNYGFPDLIGLTADINHC